MRCKLCRLQQKILHAVARAKFLADQGEAVELDMPFDRERIRQFTTITSLNLLRSRLLMRAS